MDIDDICIALLLLVLSLVIGIGVGGKLESAEWQEATIEHGYAQYNGTTGDWEWKENN